jgi:hypothetical protein
MKTIILITVLFLSCHVCFGQNKIIFDRMIKTMDKSMVQEIEVMGHKFSVGDTLTFTTGSIPNGEFLSTTLMSRTVLDNAPQMPDHLPGNFINRRFIISKIYSQTTGLNTFNTLVLDLDKKNEIFVFVDPVIALTKKEI